MKDKLYEPAVNNEQAPEKGTASVNTHTAEEDPHEKIAGREKEKKETKERISSQPKTTS